MRSKTSDWTRRLAATGLLVHGLCANPVPPDRVFFCADVEDVGTPFGLAAVAVAEAGGGKAASLAADAWIGWGLRLPAGTYTFVFRAFAPAGDQDALFVTIAGRRQRFTVPIGRWGQCAMGFTVATEPIVPFQIDGQEPGVQIDRCAVIGGALGAEDANLLTTALSPPDRLAAAATLPFAERPCRLAPFPPLQEAGPETVLSEAFESPLPKHVAGRTEPGQGPWGQALLLGLPDGRYDLPVDAPRRLAGTGTVEWWVRPRPATNAWRDQGWRYFLHGQPASGTSVRLDLSRQVTSGLTLSVSTTAGAPRQTLSLDVTSLDPEAWHHILVSWDLVGDPQILWLLVDGKGRQLQFQKGFAECRFQRLVFGNSPPGDALPFLPMDGALDQIMVSREPVRRRLGQ